jgi:hypothetical protein
MDIEIRQCLHRIRASNILSVRCLICHATGATSSSLGGAVRRNLDRSYFTGLINALLAEADFLSYPITTGCGSTFVLPPVDGRTTLRSRRPNTGIPTFRADCDWDFMTAVFKPIFGSDREYGSPRKQGPELHNPVHGRLDG